MGGWAARPRPASVCESGMIAALSSQAGSPARGAAEAAPPAHVPARRYGNAAEKPTDEVLALQVGQQLTWQGLSPVWRVCLGECLAHAASGGVWWLAVLPGTRRHVLHSCMCSAPCVPTPRQATEAYVEYDAAGRVIRGQEVKAKSR